MTYQPVTVYRREGSGWQRRVFPEATVRRINALSQQSGGRSCADSMNVRIFSGGEYIRIGDKLAVGALDSDAPDPETALTVYEISDNTCLRRAHFRISAR